MGASKQEILERAISKAIDGGWKNEEEVKPITVEGHTFLIHEYLNMPHIFFDVKEIIFNHNFAKALWPNRGIKGLERELWKGHLQDMAIADDPIAYLKENI